MGVKRAGKWGWCSELHAMNFDWDAYATKLGAPAQSFHPTPQMESGYLEIQLDIQK
jgi:hypothetical protein